MNLSYTLLSDGSSDKILMKLIDWSLRRFGYGIDQSFWADLRFSSVSTGSLRAKIMGSLKLYPSNILFIHRDAEKEPMETRRREIDHALVGIDKTVVPVIPVRMTEAWFLHDKLAIRFACGNPNGTASLGLPQKSDVEKIPDPKKLLFDLLLEATETTGRRRKKVKRELGRMRTTLAERIDDFSPLIGVPAFDCFLDELDKCLQNLADSRKD